MSTAEPTTPKSRRKARPTAAERAAAAAAKIGGAVVPPVEPAITESVGVPTVGVNPPPVAKGQKTLYEVQRQVQDVDLEDRDMTLWRPVARIEAADAKTAAKTYAESVEDFDGGELRVVPVRNITSVTVGVETRRQLTIT